MSSCGWLRHRPGGVGLRSEPHGIAGTMGPSMSWDPWPRPVARAAVGATGVYTDRRKWPLDAVLGHSCTLLRRKLRWVARVPHRHGVPAAPPSVAVSPLVGKTDSARQALREWRCLCR